MKAIIAIGGGEIGRPSYPVETTIIDKEIIRLTGKKGPRILFLPTASSDSKSYYEIFKTHFGRRLNCRTDVLWLIRTQQTKTEIERKILSSDAVYVGGGNTQLMLTVWKRTGVDKILKKAYKRGIVLSGISAGSLCWFRGGISDYKRFVNPRAKFSGIKGLGLIPLSHSPHYHSEKERRPALKEMMKTTPGIAVTLDDCCAIEIVNNTYRIISSKLKAGAFKVYWRRERFYEKIIPQRREFQPLKALLQN